MDELELGFFLSRLRLACDAAETINTDLNQLNKSLSLLKSYRGDRNNCDRNKSDLTSLNSQSTEKYSSFSDKGNTVDSLDLVKRKEDAPMGQFEKDFSALKLLGYNIMIPETTKSTESKDKISDSEDDSASYLTPQTSHTDLMTVAATSLSVRNVATKTIPVDIKPTSVIDSKYNETDSVPIENNPKTSNIRKRENSNRSEITSTSTESFIVIEQDDTRNSFPQDGMIKPRDRLYDTMMQSRNTFTPDTLITSDNTMLDTSSDETYTSVGHGPVHVTEPCVHGSPSQKQVIIPCCPVCDMAFLDADSLSYRNYHIQNHFDD